MVFHAQLFRGHTLSQTLFSFHFLPAFVLIVTAALKLVLAFAFRMPDARQLQHALAAAAAATPDGASGWSVWTHVVMHWLVLLVLCGGALITNTVVIRFVCDSLPFLGALQPKLRKNLKQVLALSQRFAGGLPDALPHHWRERLNFVGSLWFAVPFAGVLWTYYVAWDCDRCWAPPPATAAAAAAAAAAATDDDGGDAPICPSDLEFDCGVLSKSALVLLLVLWQWVVIALSMRRRPHRTAYSATVPYGDWHDLLYHDSNWNRVVADAAYAELMLATAYLVVLAAFSPNGLSDGFATFLIVCTGQSAFYAFVWCALHHAVELKNAVSFVAEWLLLADVTARARAVVTPLASPVAGGSPTALAAEALDAYRAAAWKTRWLRVGVVLYGVAAAVGLLSWTANAHGWACACLAGYCLGTLFPSVTHQFRTDLYALDAQADALLLSPTATASVNASASASANGKVNPSVTAAVIAQSATTDIIALSPASTGSPASDDADGPTASRLTHRRGRSSAEPVRMALTVDTNGVASNGVGVAVFSASPVPPAPTPRSRTRRRCCQGFRRGVVRYRIYLAFSILFVTVLTIILLAAVQRMVVLRPAELPHNFRVSDVSIDERSAQTVRLSVDMVVHGHVMSKGTITRTPAPPPVNTPSAAAQSQTQTDAGATNGKAKRRRARPYSFCSQTHAGLSLVDWALLTQLPYFEPNSADFHAFRSAFFPDFELRTADGPSGTEPAAPLSTPLPSGPSAGAHGPPSTRVAFQDVYSSARNLSVVLVRGTNALDLLDWAVDLDLWFETGAWQLFSSLLPGLGLWPAQLRANVFRAVAQAVDVLLPLQALGGAYYEPIVHYVTQTARHQPRHIAVAGHSLGGGLAKIVAAKTGRLGVSLSGPGIVEAAAKLNLTRAHVDRSTVSLVPSGDWIASLGAAGGTTYHVDCPYHRPDLCHVPFVTVCELISSCGPRPGLDSELSCAFAHGSMSSSFASSVFPRGFGRWLLELVLSPF